MGAYESETLTATYANILDNLADDVDSDVAKKILDNLSIYAHKLADVEGDLTSIKAEIDTKKAEFKQTETDFYKAREEFISYFTSPTKDITVWKEKFENYKEAYFDYRDATRDYKDASKAYVTQASEAFDEIKQKAGIGYELLIFLAKNSSEIPADAKNITIGVSEEIKDIKDQVLVTKEKS